MSEDLHTLLAQARVPWNSGVIAQAQGRLCHRLAERMRQLALRCLKQPVAEQRIEDLVQDTWVRALPRLHQVRGDSRGVVTEAILVAWLAKIMKNVAINQGRNTERHNPDDGCPVPIANPGSSREVVTPVAPGSTPSRHLLGLEEKELVRQALEAIPEKYSAILKLYFFEELPRVEIARKLGLDPGTVGKRYHEGLHLLQVKLRVLRSSVGGPNRGG
jgi:RNA polymerase sigma factor (sigma-70 family)